MMNFTPFMADTRYLEHLHKEMKLRNAREGMLMMRKNMIEGNKRANYQNEMDRVKNELYRPNLSQPSKELGLEVTKGVVFWAMGCIACVVNCFGSSTWL